MNFPPAYRHDPITPIADNVFMVRGCVPMNPIIRITRNMAIVRQGEELTVINPIRLNDDTLVELDRLGSVRHVLRLGPFHGVDDAFYMDRYKALFWSQLGGKTYAEPAIDRPLVSGGELPFENAQLFTFDLALQPEAALLLETGGGVLLTTDAIQHYGDYSHCNLPAKLMLPLLGFRRTTLVGPIWLKFMTPKGGSLRDDFSRLLQLSFDRLLAAHGTLLESGAHAAVTVAVARAYRAK